MADLLIQWPFHLFLMPTCSDGLDACFAFLPLGRDRGERLELDYDTEASPRNLLLVPPICLASAYEGAAPVAYLRRRLQQVLEANGWLAGRLRKGWGPPYVALPTAAGADPLVELPLEVEDPSAQQLSAQVRRAALPCGLLCLNRDVPLFRVAVLVGENRFVAPGNRWELANWCKRCHPTNGPHKPYRHMQAA